jgi:arylsulfatase A-like enzyme/Flp pilus assembly protein TadD
LNCSVTPQAALLLLALVPPPAATRPNVLLVTVDTLRPDALGWVAGRHATPEIDRLAAAGFRFPGAVAPAPVTLPSHASILTGLVPRRHGARDNGQPLPEGPVTLAETLGARGYATGAFVSGFPLVRAFGVDRGFAHFDDALPDGPPDRRERRALRTAAAAAAWIERAPEPWFAWVHFYDPHDPYEAPGAATSNVRGAYDAEVAYVDRALGTLRRRAGARGPVLTVLAADHGESLGEHGESTHGFFVYESTTAVPLILHWPGRVGPGQSAAPARLVDVTPTIRDLLGLPAAAGLDGVSLGPLMAGSARPLPAASIETLRPWASYGWAPLTALREGSWKYIEAPRRELYDLARDPGEQVNRAAAEGARVAAMAATLERLRSAAPRPAASVDAESRERLRALGYVGAGATPPPEDAPPGLPDPKDRIDAWNALGAGEELLAAKRLAPALARFDEVLAADPANRFALARSGQALVELGRVDEGLSRLRRAVASGPRHPESRLALAQALTRSGRHADAAEQWTELTRLQPREASHWVGLGNALGASGRSSGAAAAFGRAVALRPRDAELLTRLGFAEHAAGRTAEAAAHLAEAAEIEPGAFAHAGALGVLLARLGRDAAARAWLQKSRPTEADYPEARFQLARLLARAGEREAASRVLQEAMARAPALRERARADAELAGLLR